MNKTKSYNYSIFIIGALFFIFGFVTWLNNILIPFLKEACELTDFQASFVPFAFYISYFVMSIPSSYILKKIGFGNGMAFGLIIMAIGSILFVPAALNRNYLLFLIGLFVQGTGLSLLQTASNPYVTILGPIESAARRISVMGICNKIAGMIGILILFSALFSDADLLLQKMSFLNQKLAAGTITIQELSERTVLLQDFSNRVIIPYIVMTFILVALVLLIKIANLPEIHEEEIVSHDNSKKSIFSFPYLWLGVLAIFFYVGAEVVSIDYLVGYGEYFGFPKDVSKNFGIFALAALIVGYLLGIILIPKYISQRKAFIIQILLAVSLLVVALCTKGLVSVLCIVCLSFAHAIMWPAIWPLSIHGLGKFTKLGSALLIMAIAGGAIMPLFYGLLSDLYNPHVAYALLFISYAYLLFFATVGYKIKKA